MDFFPLTLLIRYFVFSDLCSSLCSLALIAFVVFVKSLVSHILSVNITGILIGQGSSDLPGELDEEMGRI